METKDDRVTECMIWLANQMAPATRGKMPWTNGAWVEDIKALPNSAINESASSH